MTTETWYPFPGRTDYEFSDDGSLRTADGELVTLQRTDTGYPYYAIPHHQLPDEFVHLSPDNIVDTYLPYYVKD